MNNGRGWGHMSGAHRVLFLYYLKIPLNYKFSYDNKSFLGNFYQEWDTMNSISALL